MSVIMALKELEHFLFFSNCKNSGATLTDDSLLLRVSEEQGVELTFDVPWRDLEKFQAKPHSARNLIASTIRKGAEVSLRQLDKEARKEFDIAKSAEIQSWLRYEAVTAALRSQYHHRRHHEDAMGVEIQRIRQAEGTVSDHWQSRSSCWFRCPDRGTSCITSWKKFVFHGSRSQSVLH